MWTLVAKDLGFKWDNDYDMRVGHVEFLDVLVYNYIKNKKFAVVMGQYIFNTSDATTDGFNVVS
ncbi:hypothetical protein Hanom_Chr03g00194691 [Helianthus anomalus]